MYTDQQRFAILNRVTFARKQGHPWAFAHEVAKEAGFRGGLPALMVFVKKAQSGPKKARKARVAKPVPQAVSLDGLLEQVVQERVKAALAKAIAALQNL